MVPARSHGRQPRRQLAGHHRRLGAHQGQAAPDRVKGGLRRSRRSRSSRRQKVTPRRVDARPLPPAARGRGTVPTMVGEDPLPTQPLAGQLDRRCRPGRRRRCRRPGWSHGPSRQSCSSAATAPPRPTSRGRPSRRCRRRTGDAGERRVIAVLVEVVEVDHRQPGLRGEVGLARARGPASRTDRRRRRPGGQSGSDADGVPDGLGLE